MVNIIWTQKYPEKRHDMGSVKLASPVGRARQGYPRDTSTIHMHVLLLLELDIEINMSRQGINVTDTQHQGKVF